MANLPSYKVKYEEAKLLSDFLMPMLNIHPEKRADAFQMIFHPWITHQSRNKEHICSTQEENVRDLEEHHDFLKTKCVFYRDLKNQSELHYDADCGEDPLDDEFDDPDYGFRKSP